ncbi:MAG: hypothetical protein QMC67_17125 [Candidatus Wallbacteria bacterium]
MKKVFSLSVIIAFLAMSLSFNLNSSYAAAEEKPAAVEAAAAAPEAEAAAADTTAKKTTKKAAKKATKKSTAAKKVAKGETLSNLVKAFNAVHPDVVFAAKYVNSKSEDFDKAMAKALANDLLKWKKLKIQIKNLKKSKSADLDAKNEELKELEGSIIAKYTEGAAPAEGAADENSLEPKTEKGKEILEKLRQKKAGEEGAAPAEEEKKAEEPKPAVAKTPSNVRVEPKRACYNNIEPNGESTTRVTFVNKGKSVFEGTVVPIENWISVNPTTVTIEPGSKIDVDVTIKAQESSKTRFEGSIELRTEGESSRRIPVVVRTK